MPSKSTRRNYFIKIEDSNSYGTTCCDIILLLSVITIFGFIGYGTYCEMVRLSNEQAEKSIHCLKEFHEINCNPFNLTEGCEKLNICIKDGDNFMTIRELLWALNQKLKENGALPLIGILLGATAEIRRRLRGRNRNFEDV